MEDIISQLEQELAQKDEYVERCYICRGFFLRKFASNKRIASEPRVFIKANTETKDGIKSNVEITGGDTKEVFICDTCERKLKNGEVIAPEWEDI